MNLMVNKKGEDGKEICFSRNDNKNDLPLEKCISTRDQDRSLFPLRPLTVS